VEGAVAAALIGAGIWAVPQVLRSLGPSNRNPEQLVSQTQDDLRVLEEADRYFEKGKAMENEEQYDAAVEAYKQAIALRPDYAEYYYRLAFTFERKNDWKSAVKAWKDLLQYDTGRRFSDEARRHLNQIEK